MNNATINIIKWIAGVFSLTWGVIWLSWKFAPPNYFLEVVSVNLEASHGLALAWAYGMIAVLAAGIDRR